MPAITFVDVAAQEPQPMRMGLIQALVEESQVIPHLHFVKCSGLSYGYGEQATLGGIAFRGLNETYDPSVGVVNPKTERLVIFGGTVQVDHQFEKSASHASALIAKQRAAARFYDYNFINGNPEENVKAFYGLKYRLQGRQVISAADEASADLTVDLVDELLDRVAGPNDKKVIFISKYQRRKLKRLLINEAGGASMMDVSSPLKSYEGARLAVLDEDDAETPVLPQTESWGGDDETGSIYCIRPGEAPEGEYVQGLVRGDMITHKPLAQVNTQVGDLVEMVGGLGVFHGRAAARLRGLK